MTVMNSNYSLFSPYRAFRIFSAIVLGTLSFISTATASNIAIEHTIGFNDNFQLNRWSPITVIIENTGNPINATVEVIVVSGSEYKNDIYHTTYAMDVELPTGSKKLCAFTAYIRSFSHPLTIRLKNKHRVIYSTAVNLRPYYKINDLVLIFDNNTSPDFFAAFPEGLHPVMTYAKYLPEKWYGYDGVGSLILYPDILNSLRPRQYHALIEWLKRGGYLIISASLNYGSLTSQNMIELVPAKVIGFKQLSKMIAMEKFCGTGLETKNPFLVLDTRVSSYTTLMAEKETPVIFERVFDQGKVVFTGFDIHQSPFNDWDGLNNFWKKMLTLRPTRIQKGLIIEDEKIENALLSAIPASFPNFFASLLILVLYLIVIKIILTRMDKKNAKKWIGLGWIIITVLLFSILGAKYFINSDTQHDYTFNSFLHLKKYGKSKYSWWDQTIGIYALKEKHVVFGFDSDLYSASFRSQSKIVNQNQKNIVLKESGPKSDLSLKLTNWSHGIVKMNSLIDFPFFCNMDLDSDVIIFNFKNESPYVIQDCRLFLVNRFFSLGDVEPGQKKILKISSATIKQNHQFDNMVADYETETIVANSSTPFSKRIKAELTRHLLNLVYSEYRSRYDMMHISGWITSSMIPMDHHRLDIPGENITFFDWVIDINEHYHQKIKNDFDL